MMQSEKKMSSEDKVTILSFVIFIHRIWQVRVSEIATNFRA